MKDRLEFISGIYLGVGKAILTEPDTLLLFTAGLCLTAPYRPVRGLGVGLGGLYVSRLLGEYAYSNARRQDRIVSLLAHLIGEGEPRGGTNG